MSNYKFLAFCNVPDLEDNNQKAVSPLGELSTRSRTYAEYPAVYKSDSSTSSLVTFTSTKDDQYTTMPTSVQERLLEISDWIYGKGVSKTFSNDKTSALKLISANFTANSATFTSIGEMVTNSVIWLPSHIEGSYQIDADNTVNFKIWFADANFLSEYPNCAIKVVLPLSDDVIDVLATGTYQQIATALASETQDKIEKRVASLTNGIPYTDRNVYPYSVYDSLNSDRATTVYFIVVTNGNSADASDQIIEAIQEKLLSVSKQTDAVWGVRIPDLFNPMQFTCVPCWDRLGVENKTAGGSLYSPITDYESAMTNVKKYLPSLSNDLLIKSLQFLPSFYKSLNVGFIGSNTNRDSLVKINDVFTDLSLIPPNDSEASWMSANTLTFIQQLSNLLAGAESLTPDGTPPTGIKRVTKDGVLYAAMKIGQVNYNVVTRYQFIQDGLASS